MDLRIPQFTPGLRGRSLCFTMQIPDPPPRAARRFAALTLSFLVLAGGSGCTTGKVLVTPLTVVRDTVDLPVVTVTNVFALVARSSGGPGAFAGPSWSWRGGFDFGIGLNLASWVFWGLSGAVGVVDYVVCRSFYPNFPYGISPWLKRGESWWSLYYTNTRALWKKEPREPPRPSPTPAPPPPPLAPGAPPTTTAPVLSQQPLTIAGGGQARLGFEG